ncbi:MAG: putative transposase [Parcubacteria group bacterium Licking1014_1]|nr:MAG: putative transposase [Parcubacteria group bacterium Licking1014_1]
MVFSEENDFYRGIFSIYEFNNAKPTEIWLRRLQRKKEKLLEALGRHTSQCLDKRDRMVEVLSFSFMPNHLHLLLRQKKDNGISQFMKKVNGGYAKYFNDKYDRKGHLFSRFRAVHIKTDEQLKNAFAYVHTNLISLIEPGWKEKGIRNSEKVREFLENNKRHSYPDYLGKKNFPFVTQRDFLLEVMGGIEGCREAVDNWIIYKKEMKDFGEIVLE